MRPDAEEILRLVLYRLADRRFVPEVYGEGVLRLHIVEAVKDQTEDLLDGVAGGTGLAR